MAPTERSDSTEPLVDRTCPEFSFPQAVVAVGTKGSGAGQTIPSQSAD